MKDDKEIEEILYAFSNYWREGAHDEMPPGEYLTASQAKAAIQSLIDTRVREELQSLYNYASSGTRVKTLLGYRLAELKEGKQS